MIQRIRDTADPISVCVTWGWTVVVPCEAGISSLVESNS